MKSTFGAKLKQARTAKSLKQSELAKSLGVTNTTISNWENNISKPDLDMLSYICGVLDVKASYFLTAIPPESDMSIDEKLLVKKYRELDNHGREMVDFTLEKEWERSTELLEQQENKIQKFPSKPIVNAAHARTDIEIPDNVDTSDDDIMDDENF